MDFGIVGDTADIRLQVVEDEPGVEEMVVEQMVCDELVQGVVFVLEVGVCRFGIPQPALAVEVVDGVDSHVLEHMVGLAEGGVSEVTAGRITHRVAAHVGVGCNFVAVGV